MVINEYLRKARENEINNIKLIENRSAPFKKEKNQQMKTMELKLVELR